VIRVLAISGSLRRDAWNRKVLRAAGELLPPDAELELWDGLRDVPPYDEDDDAEPAPAAVAAFRDAIAGADAILVSTPEYNHSIPGALKNAIDWASRPVATNPLRRPAPGTARRGGREPRRGRAHADGGSRVAT
jgi:chromate reductase